MDSGGPKEAQVQSYSPSGANVFSVPCGNIGATWRIRLNRPSAAAMRSYVKLLSPLVVVVVKRVKHTGWSKKADTRFIFAITLSILDRSAKFFHCCKQQ